MPPVKLPEVTTLGQFALKVPDHWARFDMSDAPIIRARREALKTAKDAVTRMQAEELFRQALAISQSARRHGALWGAGTATFYDDAVFLGFVMVFGVAPGADLSGADNQDVLRQLSMSTSAPRQHPRVVSTVELANVGEAVRVVGTETVAVTSSAKVDMLTMSTFIPVPATAGKFMLVTCCSPNLPLANEVYELFDAITSTFHFVAPERSTTTSR